MTDRPNLPLNAAPETALATGPGRDHVGPEGDAPESVTDLGALTARAARLGGERVALVFDESGAELTFADIERESGRFANALARLGIGTWDRVAGKWL